jgi:hypothetical protein
MKESGKINTNFNLCLKHQQPQTTSIINILDSTTHQAVLVSLTSYRHYIPSSLA